MTIEIDLQILREKANQVTENASEDCKVYAENALVHVLRALGCDGMAFINGIESMVTKSGNYLKELDPKLATALNEFGEFAFNGADAEAVDQFLNEKNIQQSSLPEDMSIYEQFRSGHRNEGSILLWLIS